MEKSGKIQTYYRPHQMWYHVLSGGLSNIRWENKIYSMIKD